MTPVVADTTPAAVGLTPSAAEAPPAAAERAPAVADAMPDGANRATRAEAPTPWQTRSRPQDVLGAGGA